MLEKLRGPFRVTLGVVFTHDGTSSKFAKNTAAAFFTPILCTKKETPSQVSLQRAAATL